MLILFLLPPVEQSGINITPPPQLSKVEQGKLKDSETSSVNDKEDGGHTTSSTKNSAYSANSGSKNSSINSSQVNTFTLIMTP